MPLNYNKVWWFYFQWANSCIFVITLSFSFFFFFIIIITFLLYLFPKSVVLDAMIGEMKHMYQTNSHDDFLLIWKELNLSSQYPSCLWPRMSLYHVFDWVNFLLKWMYYPSFLIQFCATSLGKLFWNENNKICFRHVLSRDQIIFRWVINLSYFPNQKCSQSYTYTKGKECISCHLSMKLHIFIHPKNNLDYSLSLCVCVVGGGELRSSTSQQSQIISICVNFRNRHLPTLLGSLLRKDF